MKRIEKAKIAQIIKIWHIRKLASKALKENNVDQWQYKDPTFFSFIKDIIKKRLYILKVNKEITGIMMLHTKEATYNEIEGKWLKDDKFIVIHKLAVKYFNLGYAQILLKYAEEIARLNNINYIRIDTHEDNIKMLNLLTKLNYNYRGIINLKLKQGTNKRLAFDKEVK